MKPLEKMFWDELAEMLHVEGMLAKSLLRMHAAAALPLVKEALADYRAAAERNLAALTGILRDFDLPAREKKSDCMMGLLLKAQQGMQRLGTGAPTDALLVSICRRAAAVQIASYESLSAWAALLTDGAKSPVKILEEIIRDGAQLQSRFKKLAAKIDRDAAAQVGESPRVPAAKKPAATEEPRRWSQW